MNRTAARDFLTGITAIVGLSGLALMLMLFGELKFITERTYDLTLHLPTAQGVKETSPVTLNGVRVGQVRSTRNLPLPARGVEVVVRVHEGVSIPAASEVSIDKSFVGEASLEFSIPQALAERELAVPLRPGSTTEFPHVGTLLGSITGAIQEPVAKFEKTAASIDRLAATYTTLGERLNELVEPRTPADVDAGKPPNVRTTLARLDSALAGANRWLGDEGIRRQTSDLLKKADDVLTQASDLAKSMSEGVKSVEKTATETGAKIGAAADAARDVAGDARSLLTQAKSTLGTIDTAAADLSSILESVNKGEGTAGQLVRNPDLYNNLRDAATRLEKALAEFQLVAEKLKAEGIRVGL